MHKTYIKNILRTIRQTISRFGAIFAIVALGVGFLAGLMATTPDMRYSGDIYFDNSKLFDVRVVGTMGLTDDDLAAIKSIDGVGDIMPAYSADMLITAPDGGTIATRIHSLPTGELEKSSPQGYLNRLEVKEGRLPVRENECVIEANSIYSSYGFGVNDTLTISPDNKDVEDTFKNTEYKIVGIVTSSYYFSLEKEDINVGNGILGLVMYVAQENFNLDVYTDFFMTADGVEALNSITDEYDDEVDKTVTAIEDISDARSEIRYKEVKEDGNEKLADANKEYEDGRKEADEKLADAQKKIDDGEKEYADGQKKLADARKELADGEADLIKGEVEIRDQEISANAQINDAYTQLDAAQSQIDSGVAAINSNVSAAKGKLTALGQSLGVDFEKSSGFAALLTASQKYPSLSDELTALNTYAARLAEIQALLASGTLTQAEIQALQQEAGEIMPKLAAIQKGAAYTAYSAAIGQLMGELSIPNPADPTLSALTEIAITLSTLDSAKAQLATAQATLTAKLQDVSVMQEQAKEQIAMGYAQLQYGRNDLEEGRAEYKKGERELLDAKKKLEDGKEEYATEKAKAEKKLADARIEIDDAQAKIDDLESPEWYVLTRNENMSAASFKSNTQKVEAIAKIFPVFFFLVAALVALTTMTRMVEEERLQIGTLKALGYSKGTIMAKYLFYALVASVLGSITGLTIGFKLFPTVIWNAYTMMYTLPKLYCPWNLKYALISSGAAIICTLLATLNACWSTLKEKPAALMLPKAPRAGKRILLERITFIWKRMKFTYKVTARNLFRYKKRLLMTVVGIAGCTALLVT
ncbi:MAG: FtsX-like permease family protein, partial [Oscillospiraceae bacterium]